MVRWTKEQAALLPAFLAERRQRASNTARGDRTLMAEAIGRLYRRHDLPSPAIIWVKSPLAALALTMLMRTIGKTKHGGSLADDDAWQYRLGFAHLHLDRAWPNCLFGEDIPAWWTHLTARVFNDVDPVFTAPGRAVRNAIAETLGEPQRQRPDRLPLHQALRHDLLRDLEPASTHPAIRRLRAMLSKVDLEQLFEANDREVRNAASVLMRHNGQHDFSWLTPYEFAYGMGLRLPTRDDADFRLLNDLASHCFLWIAREKIAVVCDRPTALHFDAQDRLHNASGPAISFSDGWAIYNVHGQSVPPWVFENRDWITIGLIRTELVAAVAYTMINLYGWERFAKDARNLIRVLDDDPRYGTLCVVVLRSTTIMFLMVTNRSPEPDGSFRTYVLPVDPTLSPLPDPNRPGESFGTGQVFSARNAVASTFGMTGEQYARLLRAES